PDLGDLRQAVLDTTVELGDATGDAGTAELLVHLEGRDHRPLVVVGLEAAGGHAAGVVRGLRFPVLGPGPEDLAVGEAGNAGLESCPPLLPRPGNPGPAGAEDPLVRPGGEVVRAHLGDRFVNAAEAVDPVHDESDPAGRVSAGVDLGEGVGDP